MEEESSPHGDVLESILSHMPTIDLLPVLHVSKSWRRAALSSLHRRQRRPLLLIHQISRRRRHRRLSAAYDPDSHSWHTLHHVTPTPSLTCHLLPLSLPLQPLAATWPLLPPPLLPRRDALIALVGRHLILAGGTCDLGDRTCSVESLSLDSPSSWEICEPMPEILRDSAAATWLAVAASKTRFYVMERGAADSARFAWFDVELGRWSPVRPIQLRISAIGMGPAAEDGGDRLVAVGLTDCGEMGMWEVGPESLEIREIGSLPVEAVARIAGKEAEEPPALRFSNVGGFGFLYDKEGRGEVFACEFGSGGKWRWEGIGRPPGMEEDPTAMVVFGCVELAVEDLKKSVYGRESGRERVALMLSPSILGNTPLSLNFS